MAEEIKKERKKRSLSLIQPTSVPTLGNYLGAMRGWKDFQDDFDTVFGIARFALNYRKARPAKAQNSNYPALCLTYGYRTRP